MSDDFHDPPSEAYGRVTDAARFAVLHEWLDELLDEMITTIEAVVTGGFSEELTSGGQRWLRTRCARCAPGEPAPS